MSSHDVAQHYNAVPNKGKQERTQSRIYHLRNSNNWVKSMLISDFLERLRDAGCPSATVLDICCGKGGDLLKWKIGNIKEIVMTGKYTDVAEVALDHCRNRYMEVRERMSRERKTPFDAHFLPADASRVRLRDNYPREDLQFDLSSCQFALHYSFSSEETARQFVQNATEALRPGGYFVGTLPDADAIVHFLRKGENAAYRNNVLTIDYADKSVDMQTHQPPLFGAKLNFALDEVVNCPEYLAYFPLLVKLCEEQGMELVYSYRFPDAIAHYVETGGTEAMQLLTRMSALEPFPPREGIESVSDNCEYAQAVEKYKTLDAQGKPMGTLSKSEWEVLSMYRVFAFQKKQDSA
ncbi:CRE-TAG-72 protein [Aphelenchoides avenae]|nr:CRE-TAG-72 protein [Aphelenchus avenae]